MWTPSQKGWHSCSACTSLLFFPCVSEALMILVLWHASCWGFLDLPYLLTLLWSSASLFLSHACKKNIPLSPAEARKGDGAQGREHEAQELVKSDGEKIWNEWLLPGMKAGWIEGGPGVLEKADGVGGGDLCRVLWYLGSPNGRWNRGIG